MKFLTLVFLLLISLFGWSNDTTIVKLDFTKGQSELRVKVLAPSLTSEKAEFIIPEMIPGTYMKVNFIRFYRNFKAVDKEGKSLKWHKKGNRFVIKNAQKLYALEYQVRDNRSSGRIWDNMLDCAGMVLIHDSAYILNFEMVNGFFKGNDKKPYKVEIDHRSDHYVSTAMNRSSESKERSTFTTKNYFGLIDQPMLISRPDTASFTISQTRFHLSVFSETGKNTARDILPKLRQVMDSAADFLGGFPNEDYYFIHVFRDWDKLGKGLFKSFGMGAALEHNNCSFYTMEETKDTNYTYLCRMWLHEYYHTFAPLSVHSNIIENFNFEKPELSRNLWMYEGMTDYFAYYTLERYKLPAFQWFRNTIGDPIRRSESPGKYSLEESGTHILKTNMFDFLSKVMRVESMYERGKLASFYLDNLLCQQSNGKTRLIDVVKSIQKECEAGKIFDDKAFEETFMRYAKLDSTSFFRKYIIENNEPDYRPYLQKLGWRYFPKDSKTVGFAWQLRINPATHRYYCAKSNKDVFKTQKGDSLLMIDDIAMDSAGLRTPEALQFFRREFKIGEAHKLTVNRKGKVIVLSGKTKEFKRPEQTDLVENVTNLSEEQKRYRLQYGLRQDITKD